MRMDFSNFPLGSRPFSDKPMTFLEPEPSRFLATVMEIAAIETGKRQARERWQAAQLRNLLQYAAERSKFWRGRIGAKKISLDTLSSLPPLTRQELTSQVEAEGCLLTARDGLGVKSAVTSGSSGTPAKFFVSQMNAHYNEIRSTAQFFIEDRDLTLNNTLFSFIPKPSQNGFTVAKTGAWLGPLDKFVKSGESKIIRYLRPNLDLLRRELEREPIGYLVASPWVIEAMLPTIDANFLKRAGAAMWIPVSGSVDPALNSAFVAAGVPVRANYSSEETGLIGSECAVAAGCYHVATSNVIVEVGADEAIEVEGERLSRVLVTHLHSYATPLIRYDIGDLASLLDRCPCGHDGPTLTRIFGRKKGLLRHADGRVSVFHIQTYAMAEIAKFAEYRIRQTDLKTIVVEIGGAGSLSPAKLAALRELIGGRAGEEFEVVIEVVPQIDWGPDVKRLGFRCEVL